MYYILLFISFFVHATDFPVEEFSIVNEVINYAKKNSVKNDIKDEDITSGMLKGALAEIDSHSTYFTKEEYSKLTESLGGSFSGIGIYIDLHEGLLHVSGTIKGMPAEKAGVQNGDYITHIDNKTTFGLTLEEASSKLRGKKGTKVKIEIIRKDAEKPIELEIARDDISIDTISIKKVDNILVISLSYFNENSFDELMKLLKKQENYKGIVIDLRSNPGGILDSAIAISSLFLEKKQNILQVSNVDQTKQASEAKCVGGKKICRNIKYEPLGENISIVNDDDAFFPKNIPVAVLVNSYSASASEITALAIQQNKRGIVVGQQTFGKGSVQSVIPLKNGERGALKLTTALYYSPNGDSIQAQGVKPDIIIPEFEIKSPEKKHSFFPKSEAEYKNHIEIKSKNIHENTELDVKKLEDFALQVAISSIKTLVVQDADNN
jgi:carboxyl-terminal processing protease